MKQKIQMGETLQSTNPSKTQTNKQTKRNRNKRKKEREKQKKNNKQIFNVQTNFWMQYGDAYC